MRMGKGGSKEKDKEVHEVKGEEKRRGSI